jgi:hypothetical protein
MNIHLECILMGLFSASICVISYVTLFNENKKYKTVYDLFNDDEMRYNMVIYFIFGYLVHYLIKKNRLTDMYCTKVCYDDQCFMVCKVNN